MRLRGCLATLALVAAGPAATAQVTFDGCKDFRGVPVASVRDASVNDVAVARIVQGSPVIFYNPLVLSGMPAIARLFWYGHECGHHVLGHMVNMRATAEREADCWSIHELARRGLVTAANLPQIQATVVMSPGDWTHLPGGLRVIDLAACLASAWPKASTVDQDAPDPADQEEKSAAVEATVVFGPWPVGSADFELEVDGESQGRLDNDDDEDSVELDPLDPGLHRFKLSDISLWRGTTLLNSGGYCQGQFQIVDAKTRYRLTLIAAQDGYHCRIQ